MSTNYPGALDDNTILESDRANNTLTVNDHAAQHNNLSDAAKAIETELGTSPKGTYTDVKTRLADAVVKTPTATQIVAPTGDFTGIVVKANVALATANLYEGRDSSNVIKFFVDKNNKVSAQGFQIGGVDLAASNLSNGVSGSGAIVLASALSSFAPLASPTFTGTPAAPTAAPGTNTTQLASTAFVTAAVAGVSTTAGTSGTLASIPSAASKTGLFYFATDQAVLYFSDGSTWTRMSVPAGTLIDWMASSGTVPTGWVAYDGGTLGGSTGIYADLYAHLGNTTTLPDTRGRVTVAKGTHADVLSIGSNDGVAVASRRPKHKHIVNDPGHGHTIPSGNQGPSSSMLQWGSNAQASIHADNNTTGISVGPQTGAEPQDTVPYIVTLKISKL